nr:uncharacterized protein LOC104085776 [Nicotiana tomentosiformis]
MRQGTDSITSYYTKMKDLWDELDVLAPLSCCDCEEARPSIELLKSQCFLQFLMGLNESYSNVRSNIFARRPVVTVNEAYAIVTQEESQGSLGVVDTHKDPLTMVPPNFKSKKKGGQSGGALLDSLAAEHRLEEALGKVSIVQQQRIRCRDISFTEEEYSQLMSLLNKPPPGDCSSNMVACTITLLSETYNYEWIIDSGASHNITPCLEKSHNSRVQVPTGNESSTSSAGSTMGLYNDKVMGIGGENNGLYILQREVKPTVGAAVIKGAYEAELWHLKLGHPSAIAVQHIPRLKNKLNNTMQEQCTIYQMAKQVRLKFPVSKSSTSGIFQLIHVDVCGPYRRPTFDRKQFFVTVVDDYSRYTWICYFNLNVKCHFLSNNKLPTPVLEGKTPYEALYGKEPVMDHLRVFGCLCFASNLPRSDKLAPRTRKAILMGYSETQKGYKLFDLDTKTFFIGRDVSFRERIFPFRAMPIENEDDGIYQDGSDSTPQQSPDPIYQDGSDSTETTHTHMTL